MSEVDRASLDTVVIGSDEYPEQLYVSPHRPAMADFNPVENNGGKPNGGFWTSTWRGKERVSEWVQHVANNPILRYGNDVAWRVEPTVGTEFLVVRGTEDIVAMAEAFPRQTVETETTGQRAIDFEAMADRYDGLWVTDDGISKVNNFLTRDVLFRDWDVESTVWFNWRIGSVKRVGEINWERHKSDN